MKAFFIVLNILFMMFSSAVISSDLAKEKRWANDIVDALIDGEAVYLNDGQNDFLTIDMPSESDSKKGIIVIHGSGVHPNWGQVVQPVRVGLSEAGYHTLSIQMPVLGNDASSDDYLAIMDEVIPRIDAAVNYLKAAGMNKIVLIAHSLGTHMTTHYLVNKADSLDKSITSFVGVSMISSTVEHLGDITIPVLDLYGDNDSDFSLQSVPNRQKASINNKGYRQQIVNGANHFFDGKDDQLLEAIEFFIK